MWSSPAGDVAATRTPRRLHDRDAVTLDALPGATFDVPADGPLRFLCGTPDAAVFVVVVRVERDWGMCVIERARSRSVSVRMARNDPTAVRVSPDGRRVVCWSSNAMRVIDVAQGARSMVASSDGWFDGNGVRRIEPDFDGEILLRGDDTGEVRGTWRQPDGGEVQAWRRWSQTADSGPCASARTSVDTSSNGLRPFSASSPLPSAAVTPT